MSTKTLTALVVVGTLLIGSVVAVIAAGAPTDGDAAPKVTPSCPEHGKSGPCAKLSSEQREQVHAQIRQLREAGATREEIRAAVQKTLKSFGVEAPKADCGAKKDGCGHDTSACGKARVGCGEVRAGCGEDNACCAADKACCAGAKPCCGDNNACCSGDKDEEANCEKRCARQCCCEGGDASTSESPTE